MRFFRAFAIVILILPIVSGCPGTPGPNITPFDPPAPIAERLASLDHIQDMVDDVDLTGDPTKTTQLKDALAAMPEFRTVVEFDGAIVGQFKDGEIVVIFNNRADGTNPVGGETPSQKLDGGINKDIVPDRLKAAVAKSKRSTAALAKPALVPASKDAVLINAMGNAYVDTAAVIAPWLGSAGYNVKTLDGSVDSLRNGVTNAGVLYMSTHGAALPDYMFAPEASTTFPEDANILLPPPTTPFPGGDGKSHFTLWTTTDVTDATIAQYRNEILAGDMTYGIAQYERIGDKFYNARHMLITEKFVRKHWKCAPGALVFIDACSSLNNKLINVCLGSKVGAGAYIGWTRPVWEKYAIPSVRYFFDRALGVNQYKPVRTPFQRPFSTTEIFSAMTVLTRLDLPLDTARDPKGIFVLPSPSDPHISKLVPVFANGVADVLLRPGIRNVKVNEGPTSKRLIVEGGFGDTPGTVTIGGAAVPLAGNGWAADRIECEIAAGTSGPVVVEVGGRESNLRRLTQWNLNMTRVFMDFPTQLATPCPSCFYEGTLQFTIRADCGTARLSPEDGVSQPTYIGAASNANIDITNAGGSFFIGQGSTLSLAPNPDDGAHVIGTCIGFNPPDDNNYIGACFFLDGPGGEVRFSPTYIAEGLIRNYTGGDFDGQSVRYGVMYSGNIVGNELNLPLSPNFNIAAGQKSTGPNSYFQWQAADAISPPQGDDPN